METTPRCIIAYTSEDGRHDAVLRAAIKLAQPATADLILYDIDAAPAFVGESPLPGAWSAAGSELQWPTRLSPADLERAGRHGIAGQVQAARDVGVQAFGWLPGKRDAGSLAAYAAQEGADLLLIPAELDSPSVGERLRGETVSKLQEATDVRIALVGEDDVVEYVQIPVA
jgi:hypothetical protein